VFKKPIEYRIKLILRLSREFSNDTPRIAVGRLCASKPSTMHNIRKDRAYWKSPELNGPFMADCLKANLPSFIAQSPEQATAQRSTSPMPEMYQQTAYSLFHC